MYLAKLEINGFKSFPNRTQLNFEEGMMGVVGPNGCGKTNILDSIRWVLGEQRPTLLRSSKHDEVIFNGTSDLPPTDMAEVSLTVKNTSGLLPIEYDEVVITRRLFRSGDSEYQINKKQCRLKDIHDLFADTGMSTHAYSVFHTGMIDAVLSENADERRFLFEEAAGITKYKTRKKEALKKLENTEADMLRLNDIISEISKNVRSLQRQAARARRFKTIRDDLKSLEAKQASAKIYDLSININEHQSDIISLRTQKEGLIASVNKNESDIQILKLEITGLDGGISQEASRSASLDGQVIRLENNLTNIQNALASGKENVRVWTGEIDTLKGRIESLTSQREQEQAQLAETSRELESLNSTALAAESGVLDLKGDIDQSQSSLDKKRQEIHLLENDLIANCTRLEGIKNSLDNLASANNGITSSVLALKTKKEFSEQGLREQKNRINESETAISEIDSKLAANQQTQIQFMAEIEENKKIISSLNADNSAAKARYEMLSQMIAHHEGYGSGIKAVFGWQAKPDGVIDTLANLLTADKRYHLAIESAINKYGQLIVCRAYDDAAVCIEYLKVNTAGRAGFLILERANKSAQIASAQDRNGLIASVAELVKCDEFLQSAVNTVFGDMAVFEAGNIPSDYPGEAVDLDGKYHGRLGTLEGGHTTVSLVGRRSELADLQDLLNNLANKIEQSQRELGQKETELTKLNFASGQFTDKKKTLLSIREKLIGDLSRIEFEFRQSASRLDQLSIDSQQSAQRAQELHGQQTEIEKTIAESKQKLASLQNQFNAAANDYKTVSTAYEKEVSSLNKQRLRLVELTGLNRKLEDDIRRFAEIIDEAARMIAQKTSMRENEQTKWQEYEKQQTAFNNELKKLFSARDLVEQDKGNLLGKRSGLTQQLDKFETELRRMRAEINGISEQIHKAELHLTEYQAQAKNIEDGIYHETGVRITSAKSDDYDENTIAAEIDRYKRIVEKLGPVNMLADDEYQTEKDRLDFLDAQMKDLNDAKSSLKEAIGKINVTAEEKFNTTFALIKENFQKVFQTLFEGGTAEVSLQNPDDVLESPIEIIARPGSKKVSSLNQLSGGERALTAISLLFSIYMVKPSPFCILDEIDAPLDDANVTRFLRLLDKFTESTQFIVITHNKKTMEAANILYGVTMDKPGVSTIVSVKFGGNLKAEASV